MIHFESDVLVNMFNLCIDYKDVTFGINKNITRYNIPNLVLAVSETAILHSLFKAEGGHIGVNHNPGSWMGIGNSWLDDNRLDGAPIKTCKAMKRIGCVRKKYVVHQNLMQQGNNASAIEQVVYFINNLFAYVGVVFVAAWTRNAKVKDIHHRNPETLAFCHLFSNTLLGFKMAYIFEAISTLRFIYCAKSLELIGDCCDAAIFRILRSVTSLWNWLRNVGKKQLSEKNVLFALGEQIMIIFAANSLRSLT